MSSALLARWFMAYQWMTYGKLMDGLRQQETIIKKRKKPPAYSWTFPNMPEEDAIRTVINNLPVPTSLT